MAPTDCDVCVIGAGSAGLSVAAGAAQLGLKTILVERDRMGGECLNTGCVPSKALLAAAKQAHSIAQPVASIVAQAPAIDFAAVKDGVRGVVARIAPQDSAERFAGLGVTVVRGTARFRDAATIDVDGGPIVARDIVIATGSRPDMPQLPGLDPARVLTNENIFDLRDRPPHLLIISGGPIGVEMAMAHRRLGCAVTIIERATLLPHDEPELVDRLRAILRDEGIDILEQAEIHAIAHGPLNVSISITRGGGTQTIAGSHLLVAAGRRPNIENLQLAAAGVEHGPRGIRTSARPRTSRRRIWALGDVIDGPHFTHAASYQAGILIRNLAFRLPAKVDYRALPWVTYTDPELAHVGLTEARARAIHGTRVAAIHLGLDHNDRAITEDRPCGMIKLVVGARGKILGASILAPAAGEMIGTWCLAIARGLSLRAMTDLILPYPTLGEIGKAAASRYYAPSLFSDRTRGLVRLLQRLPAW